MRGIIGNIRERQPNYIDMTVQKEAGIIQYKVSAANSLNDAYGNTNNVGGSGTVDLFETGAGVEYRSPTIKKNKHQVAHGAGRDRGLTRMLLDPDDFFDPSDATPNDEQLMFMRIEKFSQALGDYEPKGPINIILPKHFLQGVRPLLTLHGSAPSLGSAAGEFPDQAAMHFHLPMFSSSVYIKNLDTVGGNNLHVSFNPGMPMIELAPQDELGLYDVNVMEVLVSSSDGAASVPFNMVFGLQNGP